MFSDQTSLIFANVVGIQTGSVKPVRIYGAKSSVKDVHGVGFLQEPNSLTPEILDHPEEDSMEDFGGRV